MATIDSFYSEMSYRKQYFRSFTTWLRLSGLTDASFFLFFLFPHCRFSSEQPPDWTESLHSVSFNKISFILLKILNIPSCFKSDPVSVPRYFFFIFIYLFFVSCLLFLFFFFFFFSSRLDFYKGRVWGDLYREFHLLYLSDSEEWQRRERDWDPPRMETMDYKELGHHLEEKLTLTDKCE